MTVSPGESAPTLQVETVRHGAFDLALEVPEGGTFVAFHRGRHCKWTRRHLKEMDDRIGDFALRGIRMVAVSGDTADAAATLVEEMQIIRLPIAFGVDVAALADTWGLRLTRNSQEEGAPPLHLEPAQAWVRRDGVLGALAVQSGPNLWADMTNSIRAIENTMEKFPERGCG